MTTKDALEALDDGSDVALICPHGMFEEVVTGKLESVDGTDIFILVVKAERRVNFKAGNIDLDGRVIKPKNYVALEDIGKLNWVLQPSKS